MDVSDRIDDLIVDARSQYVSRRPESKRLAEEAARFLPGGNTRSALDAYPFPFRIASARGAVLTDVDGYQYVDLLGNYSAGLFGANPGLVREAIERSLDSGWGYGAVNQPEVELARLICQRFPSIDQVRFTNSGTEANLMAITAARCFTGRDAVVVFKGAYHGAILGFGDSTRSITLPYDWIVCDYNRLETVESAFREHGSRIAGVLVEPMLGAGGCIPGNPDFLEGIAHLCQSNGSVLIFDEVMTSRLSSGGAQNLLGISPDITTLGKYLAGGMTFGAFGGRREIMGAFDSTSDKGIPHSGTFNNNMFSMSAGVAALTSGLGPGILEGLTSRGDRLRKRLNEIFEEASVEACATGWGSIMAIHPTAGPIHTVADLSQLDMRVANLLFMFLADAGFYIAPRGYFALSLEITETHLDRFVEAIEQFVALLSQDV